MKFRRLTHDDIVSARHWAETNAGDDNPLDVMAHKLLEHMAGNHGDSSGYHERTQSKCEALMAEIETRFKVEDDEPPEEAAQSNA